jgi:hypothetical protein
MDEDEASSNSALTFSYEAMDGCDESNGGKIQPWYFDSFGSRQCFSTSQTTITASLEWEAMPQSHNSNAHERNYLVT